MWVPRSFSVKRPQTCLAMRRRSSDVRDRPDRCPWPGAAIMIGVRSGRQVAGTLRQWRAWPSSAEAAIRRQGAPQDVAHPFQAPIPALQTGAQEASVIGTLNRIVRTVI